MRLALAFGAAVAALTMTASAQPNETHDRVFIRHAGGPSADANNDGWISRNEARDAADAAFARMDENDDGRLSEDERGARMFNVRVGDGENCNRTEEGEGENRRVRIECTHVTGDGSGPHVMMLPHGGPGEHGPRVVIAPHARGEGGDDNVIVRRIGPGGEDDNCNTETTGEGENRRVTVTCTGDGGNTRTVDIRTGEGGNVVVRRNGEDENCTRTESGEGERRRVVVRCGDAAGEGGERDVVIHRVDGGGTWAGVPPVPPVPAAPFMMFGHSSEADRNNDGFLSRDEFRNAHLRFFDAADINNDGRIEAAPRPPAPPEPPEAPRAPRHR